MDLLTFFILFCVLFVLELFYFKIAYKYSITDLPNNRSSHTKVTIRGGGVIFSLALLIESFYCHWQYEYFLAGLFLIAVISFIDDVKSISNSVRILFHLVAVALLFTQLQIYMLPFYWIVLGFVFVIGTINAVNFMDGINGITGAYSLITIITLFYINKNIIVFTQENYLILSTLSLLVFNFFNFRTRAKCFAGDVGSVSIAFIMVFFILQLILKTNNLSYIFLLLIYGIDVVVTIFFRIIRKENVFKAHRSHFYQFLVNEKEMPHLFVSTVYAIVQVAVNVLIITFSIKLPLGLLLPIIAGSIFILLRWYLEGAKRLFNSRA